MYKLTVTAPAERDLDEILGYIAAALGNPQAAVALAEDISKCYDDLSDMPFMYEECRDPRLKTLGYRRVVIGHYVMVYRVDETCHTVYILRFFYGPSDYEKMI